MLGMAPRQALALSTLVKLLKRVSPGRVQEPIAIADVLDLCRYERLGD